MTLFAVLFEDDGHNAAAIRKAYLQRHFAFLEANAETINSAGPLSREDDAFAGGLWLVEAEAVDDVDRLVKEDPFWPTGLRKSVQILKWNRVFIEGALVQRGDVIGTLNP
ncbi:MAG: YciI family protein [Rhizobium sp.]|uniref:YciI family protein n=1 Tax=Rhizobium sp. SYY.PMSO TaxID=3382192 RepID=UPI00398FD046